MQTMQFPGSIGFVKKYINSKIKSSLLFDVVIPLAFEQMILLFFRVEAELWSLPKLRKVVLNADFQNYSYPVQPLSWTTKVVMGDIRYMCLLVSLSIKCMFIVSILMIKVIPKKNVIKLQRFSCARVSCMLIK